MKDPCIVVVGGGFAGLNVVRMLRGCRAEVILIDRRNFHLFQPLLFQAATGGLSASNISTPLRAILKSQKNVTVLMDEVIGFDLDKNIVRCTNHEIIYDKLVVATGSSTFYFGNDHWQPYAPGLKSVEDAALICRRIYEYSKWSRETTIFIGRSRQSESP